MASLALESRVFLQDILSSLDRCFKLIGEKPVAPSGRLHDVFAEDFKRELAGAWTTTLLTYFEEHEQKSSGLSHLSPPRFVRWIREC
jgi:hypothetical protein